MITAAKSGMSPRGWGYRLPPARLGKAEWGGLGRAQAVGEGMGEGVMRDCCLQEAGWLRTGVQEAQSTAVGGRPYHRPRMAQDKPYLLTTSIH